MQTLYRQQTFLTVRPMWRKRRRFPTALPFFLSSIFLVFGGIRLFDQRDLDLHGISAQAIITGRNEPSGIGGQSEIRYRFNADGHQYDGASSVTYALYQRTKPGDPIDIRYLPDAPDPSRCVQATEYRQALLISGIGAVLFVVSITISRRSKRSWALAR